MEEIAHLQGALVLGDEVSQGPGQAIAAGKLQPLIDMRLKDSRAGLGIVQRVVGIVAPLLVFNEPLRPVQFADVVI
jgi:hypothetical protein